MKLKFIVLIGIGIMLSAFYYVDNISFRLDLKIVFLTIKKVFYSEGINSGTAATMEKFIGN